MMMTFHSFQLLPERLVLSFQFLHSGLCLLELCRAVASSLLCLVQVVFQEFYLVQLARQLLLSLQVLNVTSSQMKFYC